MMVHSEGSFLGVEMMAWEGQIPSMTPCLPLPYVNAIPVLAAC